MDAVEGGMDCTKSVQLLEEPGLSMGLEICVAKLKTESGGAKTGGTFSSIRKMFDWELKFEIVPI